MNPQSAEKLCLNAGTTQVDTGLCSLDFPYSAIGSARAWRLKTKKMISPGAPVTSETCGHTQFCLRQEAGWGSWAGETLAGGTAIASADLSSFPFSSLPKVLELYEQVWLHICLKEEPWVLRGLWALPCAVERAADVFVRSGSGVLAGWNWSYPSLPIFCFKDSVRSIHSLCDGCRRITETLKFSNAQLWLLWRLVCPLVFRSSKLSHLAHEQHISADGNTSWRIHTLRMSYLSRKGMRLAAKSTGTLQWSSKSCARLSKQCYPRGNCSLQYVDVLLEAILLLTVRISSALEAMHFLHSIHLETI